MTITYVIQLQNIENKHFTVTFGTNWQNNRLIKNLNNKII